MAQTPQEQLFALCVQYREAMKRAIESADKLRMFPVESIPTHWRAMVQTMKAIGIQTSNALFVLENFPGSPLPQTEEDKLTNFVHNFCLLLWDINLSAAN